MIRSNIMILVCTQCRYLAYTYVYGILLLSGGREIDFFDQFIHIHTYYVVLYYCRCLNEQKKFNIRQGRKSDATVIMYV